MLQEIRTVWTVDTKDIEAAKRLMSEAAKEAGVAETDVNRLNGAYQQTAKSIQESSKQFTELRTRVENLASRERELLTLRSQTNDPRKLAEYDRALGRVRARLADIATEDKDRIKRIQQLERLQTLLNKRIEQSGDSKKIAEYERKLEDVNAEMNRLAINANKAEKELQELGIGGSKAGNLLKQGLQLGIGFAGAELLQAALQGIKQEFIATVDAAKDFESALDSLSAITGAEGEDLEKLREAAQNLKVELDDLNGGTVELGADPTAALAGFERIGSAIPLLLQSSEGLKAITEDILILDKASKNLSFEDAVLAQTNVINQFKNEMDGVEEITALSSRAVNVFAASAKLGAVEITGQAAAIEKFGTTAAQSFISLEESSAAVQIAGERISDLSTVGTNLRNIILKLNQEQGNLNPTFKDAEGNAQGLVGSLRNLAAQNLSTAELTQKFGSENVNAAQILLTNINRLEDLTGALDEAGKAQSRNGIAAEQAAKNSQNAEAATERRRQAWERFRITIGSAVLPILTALNDFLARIINSAVNFANSIGSGIAVLKEYSSALILLVTGLLAWNANTIKASVLQLRNTTAVIANTAAKKANAIGTKALSLLIGAWSTIVGLATGKLKLATVAQRALNLVLKANPIGLVIAIIGGLVAAFVKLYNTSQTLRAGLSGTFQALKQIVTNVVKGIVDQFVGLGKIIQGALTLDFSKVKEGGKQFADGFKQTYLQAGKGAGDAFNRGFDERVNRETFEGLGEEVGKALDSQSEEIRDQVNEKIAKALEEGKLTNAQADELQNKLIENFDQSPIEPEVSVVPTVEADLQPAKRTLDQLRQELALLEKGFTGTTTERDKILALKGQISDLEAIIKVDSGSLTQAQKDAERLRESLETFRIQIQVERAGGADSFAGQDVLEQQRIKEIEADKAFQALRIKNEQDAAAILLQERVKFAEARAKVTEDQAAESLTVQKNKEIENIRETNAFKSATVEDQKRIELQIETTYNQQIEALKKSELQKDIERINQRTKSQEEAVSQRVAIATDELTRLNIIQASRLEQAYNLESLSADQRAAVIAAFVDEKRKLEAQALINEGDFAGARKLIEEDVNAAKIQGQIEYLRKVLEVNRTVRDENAAILSSLQFSADSGGLDESGQAELKARTELQAKLNRAVLDGEKALQDAVTNQAKEGLESREELEKESIDRRIQTGFDAIDQIYNSTADLVDGIKAVMESLAEGGEDLGQRLGDAAQGALGIISGFYALQAQAFEQAKQRELNAAGDNAAKRAEIEKKYAQQTKRTQKAQAIIGAAKAAISIFSAPAVLPQPADFILKLALAGAVAAQTRKQIQLIDSQGFREGVVNLHGPGTETSDSIPAKLSKGESVITAKQTRRHIDLLTEIHKGRVLKAVQLGKGLPPVYAFDDERVKQAAQMMASQPVYQDQRLQMAEYTIKRPDILLSQPNSSTFVNVQEMNIDYGKLADTLAPRIAAENVKKSERVKGKLWELLRETQNRNIEILNELRRIRK